jgi:branched-chain amino acid transport system substrate-binding protein
MSMMRRDFAAGLLAAPLATRIARASAPLLFAQVIELTGPAGRAGDAWRNGVEMAVQEINAAGGVAGRSLQMDTFNSDNGRAEVHRALQGDVFALLGPLTAGEVRAAAPMARAARVVEIVAADAADAAAAGGRIFEAGPGQAVRLPRLAAWLHDEAGARRVSVVWSGGESGRAGHDLLVRELRARGIDIASEHAATPSAGAEVTGVARAAPDAAVILLGGPDCVLFLREARRQALPTRLVGDATLAAPRVLAQAGSAAEGVRCQLGFAAEAPEVAAFRGRYAAMFKQDPDEFAAEGYTAVGMLAAGVARMGRVDRLGLADALHGPGLKAGAPGIILDSSWNAAGEMDRATFMVEVRQGHAAVLRTLG